MPNRIALLVKLKRAPPLPPPPLLPCRVLRAWPLRLPPLPPPPPPALQVGGCRRGAASLLPHCKPHPGSCRPCRAPRLASEVEASCSGGSERRCSMPTVPCSRKLCRATKSAMRVPSSGHSCGALAEATQGAGTSNRSTRNAQQTSRALGLADKSPLRRRIAADRRLMHAPR